MASDGRLEIEKRPSNEPGFGKDFVKLSMASSISSKISSSAFKMLGSPSKALITINKRKRMIFMNP